MENRYLYRGKRIDNGEWVVGHFYEFMGKSYIFEPPFTSKALTYEVEPSTICQCTGLKDKNDKQIFENDIVSYWDSYSTENGLAEADCIGKVVWDDETISFQVTNRLSAESWEVLDDECSVVGNAIDNPELLEV
jgi:uncharacterized phage protein (TIGR01671 family)|nr:MAG TPA: YopX protein [Caudoviricetes sp.]